jgi:hypothetical protein
MSKHDEYQKKFVEKIGCPFFPENLSDCPLENLEIHEIVWMPRCSKFLTVTQQQERCHLQICETRYLWQKKVGVSSFGIFICWDLKRVSQAIIRDNLVQITILERSSTMQSIASQSSCSSRMSCIQCRNHEFSWVRNSGMVRELALTPWLFKILSYMLCSILISFYRRFRENSSVKLGRYERKQIF